MLSNTMKDDYVITSNGERGNKVTTKGWFSTGSQWRYLKDDSSIATGWLSDRGKWYYLNSNGEMLANRMQDGYRLGSDGAWTKDDVKSLPFKDTSEHRLEGLSKYDHITVSGDFIELFRQSAYYAACNYDKMPEPLKEIRNFWKGKYIGGKYRVKEVNCTAGIADSVDCLKGASEADVEAAVAKYVDTDTYRFNQCETLHNEQYVIDFYVAAKINGHSYDEGKTCIIRVVAGLELIN